MAINPAEVSDAIGEAWMTRHDVAAYSKFSVKIVDEAALRNELKSYVRAPGRKRKRGERRFLRSDVDRWLRGE